jgi:hypothetical protein
MVGTIICEVDTIICDIGTINVRFYLLEIRYPHGYHRITRVCLLLEVQKSNKSFIIPSTPNQQCRKILIHYFGSILS